MSFDKAKAMRNAERHVAQGKIGAAIAEYRSVVDNDPRDIATLNMLGDLYAKRSEKRDAVECYMKVAEHYHKQGFAQKAIAIYNKISRIQPESIEVSAKLAELHKVKGSLHEAREHYATLAEHYKKTGHMLEALSMYKQIALLDPNNTEVCLELAEAYLRENQKEDAVEAYAEAGARFSRKNKQEDAIKALMKGFDIKSTDLRILNGLVKAQTALGRATRASSLLAEILENDPYNRDVLFLLIECCIESQNAAAAESAVIKLVEIEPANFPKFLDLVRIYLNVDDPESAARILTMSSEYMLAAGQAEECERWINEILERDPMQVSGLRLLVQYNSALRNVNGFRAALERLYNAATVKQSPEDEHFALAQLVMMRPDDAAFTERLKELEDQYGFEFGEADKELLTSRFAVNERDEVAAYDGGAAEWVDVERNGETVDVTLNGDAAAFETSAGSLNGHAEPSESSLAIEQKIQKEIDSVIFYIENDYNDLAEKALAGLAREYGDRPEFAQLRNQIGAEPPKPIPVVEVMSADVVASPLGVDEMRSEFGIDATEDDTGDYDTHFQMAIAYQEMGLMEEAIHEYQEAINLTKPADGTRRFFHCANLLAHCFLKNEKAGHAIEWINRALETPNVSDEEHHGLWYELGLAYEAKGDDERAATFFEKIYTENVDFRDVSRRVKDVVSKG